MNYKTEVVEVNQQEFTLQSVSPSWYFDNNDRHLGGNNRDTRAYMDSLFRNVVVAPQALTASGFRYFEERYDIVTAEKLLRVIENFLRTGDSGSAKQSKPNKAGQPAT